MRSARPRDVIAISESAHWADYSEPSEPKRWPISGFLLASIASGGLWLLAYWGFKALMRYFGVNMDGAL